MRILAVADSIYERTLYKQHSYITGLAVMVRDICNEISKDHECFILPYALNNNKILSYGNLHILQSGLKKYISFFSIKTFFQGIAALFIKSKRQLIRQKLIGRYFIFILKKYNIDLINFHDFTPYNSYLIELCFENKIPYVVTMHMYVGMKYKDEETIMRQYQTFQYNVNKAFLLYKNMKVITVSSGMKRRIMSDYPHFNPQNITVILNAEKELMSNSSYNYNNTNSKKILLIIGSVQTRKNQLQLFSAIKYIPESIKSEIEFHFIGNDNERLLSRNIKIYGLENICKDLGIIPHKDLAEYYNNCFATISLSLLESFGLTFIESFAFGKPVIMFDDLDAFEDIYSEDCCVPITEHTDEAVANAIINCVNKTWDEAKIKQHAKKFNMDTLRDSYISLYNNILNNDTTENNSRNRL